MKSILLAVILLFFSSGWLFGEGITKEEEAFLLAEKAFTDGFYEASIDIFNGFLKEFPDSAMAVQANLYIGKCYLYQNKVNEALNKLLEQLYIGAGDSQDELYCLTAEAFFRKKDYKESVDYYNRLIKEFPQSKYINDYLYFYLGEANFYQDKFETALDYYRKALALSQDALAKNIFSLSLGWVNLKLKKHPEAKAIFELIPYDELDQRSQDVLLLGKATLLSQEGNFEAALSVFDKLLNKSKDGQIVAGAILGKADCFLGLAKYSEAISICQRLLNSPDAQVADKMFLERARAGLTQAMFFLGTAYADEGSTDLALAEYKKILELGNNNLLLEAIVAIAKIYKRQNRYDEAIEYFEDALNKADDKQEQSFIAFQAAECYEEQARFDEAIKKYQYVTRLSSEDNPLFVKSLLRIAKIYEKKEQVEEARNIYAKIMEFNVKEASYAKEKYAALGN